MGPTFHSLSNDPHVSKINMKYKLSLEFYIPDIIVKIINIFKASD